MHGINYTPKIDLGFHKKKIEHNELQVLIFFFIHKVRTCLFARSYLRDMNLEKASEMVEARHKFDQ